MESQSTVSVVVIDDDGGEKVVFGRTREKLLRVTSVSVGTLGENVTSLCEYVGRIFSMSQAAVGDLTLDTVEVTVEVTAKGEVRLIGAASAEVKGGLKLQFKRSTGAQ